MNEKLIFKTDRLVLRPITERDVASYEKQFIDYEVIRHLSDKVPWPYPENGVSDWVTNHILPSQGNDRWFWGIFLQSDPGSLIGGIELWQPATPENRGFWLGRSHWGKGYMTEALEPITEFAFNEAGFSELILSNAVGNTRSSSIKKNAGAVLIKTQAAGFVDPSYTEHELWRLSTDDWRKSKTTG